MLTAPWCDVANHIVPLRAWNTAFTPSSARSAGKGGACHRLSVEDACPARGRQPHAALAIPIQVPDDVVRHALGGAVPRDGVAGDAQDAGSIGADPQRAIAIGQDGSQAQVADVHGADTRDGCELRPVEAREALARGYPEIAALVLGEAGDGVLRQAVLDAPLIDDQPCRGLGKRRHARGDPQARGQHASTGA